MVAACVRRSLEQRELDAPEIWSAEVERHFALIAARNLIRALDLDPPSSVELDCIVRSELIEGRDLHEHWDDNMPVFNVTPRPSEPRRRSGKSFAQRNPRKGPYSWLGWHSDTGPELLPNVPSAQLHDALDAVQAEVLGTDASLTCLVPSRSSSPWIRDGGEWWPMPVDV